MFATFDCLLLRSGTAASYAEAGKLKEATELKIFVSLEPSNY